MIPNARPPACFTGASLLLLPSISLCTISNPEEQPYDSVAITNPILEKFFCRLIRARRLLRISVT